MEFEQIKKENIEEIKFLLFLSKNQIINNNLQINYKKKYFKEKNSQPIIYYAINQIILAIFIYNNELTFDKKIELFKEQYKYFNLNKYFKIKFDKIKKIIYELKKLKKEKNVFNFIEYSKEIIELSQNEIKLYNEDLYYIILYYILLLLKDNDLIFENQNFTLELIQNIEKSKKENSIKASFYLSFFDKIINSDNININLIGENINY